MHNEHDSGAHAWKVLALALLVVLAAGAGVFWILRDTKQEATARSEQTKTEESIQKTPESGSSKESVQAGTTEPAEGASAQTADAADTQASEEAPAEEETLYDIRITFADGFHHTRVEGTTAYLMEGRDNPAGEAIKTLTSDKMGRCYASLPAGDYTLVFGDETYYDGMENLTIGAPEGPGHDYCSDIDSGEGYIYWKYLLPRQGGNAICFVLEWKGPDDLDLCVFNASAKRYISAVQPEDGMGGFLSQDDGDGSPGWEVVVIRDYTKSEVYTPFIRDGNSLMRGALSAMEARGVRLSVLDENGLLFSQEADPEERAALWMPCYVHKGKVIKDGVYEYDPAKYAWAAYSKF